MINKEEDKKRDPDEEAQLDAFLDLILDMCLIYVKEDTKKVMEEAKGKD